jgi:hypothetical protein
LLFNFAFRIRHQEGPKKQTGNGTECETTSVCLVHAEDINFLGKNINIINKNTEALTEASKEVGLEVGLYAQETKCMFMSRHQPTGQNHSIGKSS